MLSILVKILFFIVVVISALFSASEKNQQFFYKRKVSAVIYGLILSLSFHFILKNLEGFKFLRIDLIWGLGLWFIAIIILQIIDNSHHSVPQSSAHPTALQYHKNTKTLGCSSNFHGGIYYIPSLFYDLILPLSGLFFHSFLMGITLYNINSSVDAINILLYLSILLVHKAGDGFFLGFLLNQFHVKFWITTIVTIVFALVTPLSTYFINFTQNYLEKNTVIFLIYGLTSAVLFHLVINFISHMPKKRNIVFLFISFLFFSILTLFV